MLNSTSSKETLSRRGCDWVFIPKRASWYGSHWESLIGLTKNALKKVFGRAQITLSELQTIIVEIEAVLNDRPLTYVSTDIDEEEALTPSHFTDVVSHHWLMGKLMTKRSMILIMEVVMK